MTQDTDVSGFKALKARAAADEISAREAAQRIKAEAERARLSANAFDDAPVTTEKINQ